MVAAPRQRASRAAAPAAPPSSSRPARALREQEPDEEGRSGQDQDGVVEPARWGGQGRALARLQPVGGEARRDPPADQRHEASDGTDRQPVAQHVPGQGQDLLEMREQVGQRQQADQHHDRQVAPVPAGGDLAADRARERGEEAHVEHDAGPWPEPGTREHGEPGGDPEQDQSQERPPAQRQAAGPVRHGGHEEAGDDGRDVAEQHLVAVPGERRHGGRQPRPGERRQPERQSERRPGGAQQEEGAEAVLQHGWEVHDLGTHRRCSFSLHVSLPAPRRSADSIHGQPDHLLPRDHGAGASPEGVPGGAVPRCLLFRPLCARLRSTTRRRVRPPRYRRWTGASQPARSLL
jgi:hypothetical protein